MSGHQNWFRPMQGSTFHLEAGRESAAFGFSKIVTACGKSFFEGDKYLRGNKKKCTKCEAAQAGLAQRKQKENRMVEDFFQRIQSRARKGKMLHLENLCDIRDYIAENEWQIEAEGGMMKFYAKCADSMDCAPATVRDDLGIIRNYPDDDLKRWFVAGLGKDHIEAANWLQNEEACKYDAAHLLDKAVELGGPTGKRMTVPELEAFALGEKLNRPTTYKYIQTLTGWAVSIPKKLGWDADLTAEFEADVKRFVERWFV